MSKIGINWAADLQPNPHKMNKIPKTEMLFLESKPGQKPDIYKDPVIMLIKQ